MSRSTPRFFDCFTDRPGGGNPVAIVLEPPRADASHLQALAQEIGAPATCFLGPIDGTRVHARFFSPRTEYTMCGHAVIGLFTMLLQDGDADACPQFTLVTPAGLSPVYVESPEQGLPQIMLELPVPRFRGPIGYSAEISSILKIPVEDFSTTLPVQIAKADFVHLLVPVASRDALSNSVPDFASIAEFCRQKSVQSIAIFTPPDASTENLYQIREFCPAIGVDESAAAGTTNGSVSAYLAAQGALVPNATHVVTAQAHQGAWVGRPSVISTQVHRDGGKVIGVRAGGTAVSVGAI